MAFQLHQAGPRQATGRFQLRLAQISGIAHVDPGSLNCNPNLNPNVKHERNEYEYKLKRIQVESRTSYAGNKY